MGGRKNNDPAAALGELTGELGKTLLPALVSIGTITVTRWTFNFDDPADVFQARCMFAFCQLCLFVANIYLYLEASKCEIKGTVKVKRQDPENPMGDQIPTTVTIREHDQECAKKKITQQLISVAIVLGIHYKWEVGIPLVIQSVLGPFTLYRSALCKIYLQDEHVKRPFPEDAASNPMQQFKKMQSVTSGIAKQRAGVPVNRKDAKVRKAENRRKVR